MKKGNRFSLAGLTLTGMLILGGCGGRSGATVKNDAARMDPAAAQAAGLIDMDEAAAIEKLITYYGMTQEDAAAKLGRAQSTIANKLRLLRLTEKEREFITKYGLTERHARALLRLGSPEDRLFILGKIIKSNLNVERSEKLIDEFIGSQRDKVSYKKRSLVFQNVKMFVNTINKAVETMQAAGISADSRKIQNEDYIEYRVRIPIQKK